jgi:hypothetical protein
MGDPLWGLCLPPRLVRRKRRVALMHNPRAALTERNEFGQD